MKSFLIILSLAATAYAGVGVVTPEIEAEALRLWRQYCDGASEGGTEGNTLIYCKRARGAIKQTFEHTANLPEAAPVQDQIVFVQPPTYHYKHDVVVRGGGVAARKTVIYVKPAKNTHEVNVRDQTNPAAAPQKPTLYFLKGSHGGDSSSGPQPGTTLPNTYLPPPTTTSPPTPPPTYLPPNKPSGGYNYPPPEQPLVY
jgi:hypothetical protein